MRTVFGPINSRRFGSSLGVDLSPAAKQCNFDCLYCELSPDKTLDKQEKIVEVGDILKSVKENLNKNRVDVITITANGEPTLYPYLDELIDGLNTIKNETQTLILTNSSTLVNEKTFNSLLKLDQVKLSLDAVTKNVFKKIDRPHVGIEIDDIVKKVIEFSHCFSGKLFIEILFVHGLNDTKEEIEKLNQTLLKIKATRIDLSTIDRPPAYPVVGLSYSELFDISLLFNGSLPIHIASRVHANPNYSYYDDEDILGTLHKRPLTLEDIELLFDEDSKKRFEKLLKESKITIRKVGNLEFFTSILF